MALDPWIIGAVAAEVHATCAGGRIQRIVQPAPSEVLLEIYRERHSRLLLLSADPTLSRLHLVEGGQRAPTTPPAFCQALRRHLEGARLLSCRQSGWERLVCLELEGLGVPPRRLHLWVELTGRQANLVLADAKGSIIACLRPTAADRRRSLLPGSPYTPPPQPPGRVDPLRLLQEAAAEPAELARRRAELQSRLTAALEGQGSAAPEAAILATVFGVTPLLARAVVAWAAGAPGAPGGGEGQPGRAHGAPTPAALARTLLGTAEAALRGDYRPCVLQTSSGPLPAAWPLPGCTVVALASPSTACDRVFTPLQAQARIAHRRWRLLQALRTATGRVQRRLDKQRQEWQEAQGAAAYRQAGELLLAFGRQVPRGASSVQLPSFEDPTAQVRIALDPGLSAVANAQRYLRRYQKARRAQVEVARRLEATEQELQLLQEWQLAAEQAEGEGELGALEEELAAHGILSVSAPQAVAGKGAGARRPAARDSAAPPLRFAGPEGWTILVGRSAAGNDRLTMRLAQPDDLWLHARGLPGSHVLLRSPTPQAAAAGPPPEALLAAARCAAHYSAGRGVPTPVDYTLRRHVWKPSGARPGLVLYREERTLWVDPGPLPPPASAKSGPPEAGGAAPAAALPPAAPRGG